MIARIWRGWAAADSVDEIAADLHEGALARYTSAPGNVSAHLLRRPVAGGVELMTFSLWESSEAVPQGVEEDHPLLVARETMADCWEITATPEAVAQAA
jgi:heme-degrading monooxygenase HmoA